MQWFISVHPKLPTLKALRAVFAQQFTPEAQAQGFALRDSEGKIRVRLYWNTEYVGIEALRGYEKAAKKTAAQLLGVGLVRSLPSLDEIRLEPGMQAREAFVRIATHLLRTMQATQPGTVDDLDIEFLHDFRVALRRTRSLLSELRAIFAPPVYERWKRNFKAAGTASGAQRDLDVWLEELQGCKDDAVLARVAADRAEAHRELVGFLNSAAWRNTQKAWEETLQSPENSRRFTPLAQEPIEALALSRLQRQLRRVLKDGRTIGADSPAQALHTLRIDCKKLRYLLEFFAPLFPDTAAMIAPLKSLQEVLGNHQDAYVQLERIEVLKKDAALSGAETQRTLEALTIELHKSHRYWRKRFAAAFGAFDRHKIRVILEKDRA